MCALIKGFKKLIIPTGIVISSSSASIKVGTTYQLVASIVPNTSTNQKIHRTSSNENIATVNDDGLVVAVGEGAVTITASTDMGGYTDTCECSLYVIHTTGVSLNESSIDVIKGKTFQLVATVTPADTSYPDVTWYSSNTSVATVSSNGLVTYVGDGNCTITVTTVDGGYTASCAVTAKAVPPVYFSEANFNEYQNLVDTIGSIKFCDTGCRFRFNYGVYIGNRTALDFNGSTMRKINLDTLSVTCSKSSTINGRVRYFGDNRILTRSGIADFNGNIITSFNYCSVTPGDECIVRANCGNNIYKGVVDGDSITFTCIGTACNGSQLTYGHCGLYAGYSGESSSGRSSYVNPSTCAFNTFSMGTACAQWAGDHIVSGADGKAYRIAARNNGRGRLQKIGTGDEGLVGKSLSTTWGIAWGGRFGKFLGNVVSGNTCTSNGTGNSLGSNNYFINTNGTLTCVQANAFAYDTSVWSDNGFIDEKGRLYPKTEGGGSGVILKTNCTFTDLNRQNPYLWR